MKKWVILVIAVVLVILVIELTFQYLITKNKIKVSKISKLFYTDDKTFIKTWEKRKERGKRGMLMYFFKEIIPLLYPAYLFWANYSEEYRLTWFVLLVIYISLIILVLFSTLPRWEVKYIKLKEIEKMENDNIRISNN